MYEQHPSRTLNSLFQRRPYQGAEPEESLFLFVGLDANYDAAVEELPVFDKVVEYHSDGAAFWRRYGVHHPFLLPPYRGDGQRYHQNFARIGFGPTDADKVSFIELLHVPTVGRNRLAPEDFDAPHLERINRLITAGVRRYVFVSAGVVGLMRRTGRFGWLSRAGRSVEILPTLFATGETQVRLHLHFSNYGKFQAQMESEARGIRMILEAER